MKRTIKQIREEKGILQKELAIKANKDVSTIWRIENTPGRIKNITVDTLLLLCDILGVDIGDVAIKGYDVYKAEKEI